LAMSEIVALLTIVAAFSRVPTQLEAPYE